MEAKLNFALEIKRTAGRDFEGYASTFGNVDLGRDIILPGAFQRSIAEHKRAGSNPSMFWMHRADQVPGAWREVREDGDGLYVKGELADTPLGAEIKTLLSMKAVRGLSIGGRTIKADFDTDGNRRIAEFDLMEISVVSLAMNPLAQVSAAKAARLSDSGEYVPSVTEFERMLRTQGYSRTTAKTICARVFSEHDEDADARALLTAIERFTAKMRAA